MGRELNVIAFTSGGKDSFFSLLHCIANGHKVIALANLYPPNLSDGAGMDTDLNSHMYQTVGHTLIPLYAEILSLPLYRQEICGSAVDQAKDYGALRNELPPQGKPDSATEEDEDETESMLTLLQRVKQDHPEADAVSSGAISSTYQRTRIESVALRMGLVPLAYLWQYPELPTPGPRSGGLLEDMAMVGLDARIIKIASAGLDEDLLWENACAEGTRRKMARAMRRFGGNVLGEGGEFETLVVDGPWPLWKGAVEVRADQRKIIRGGGGEALMTFVGGCIRQKNGKHGQSSNWLEKLRLPSLLDCEFKRLLKNLDYEDCHPSATESSISAVLPFAAVDEWKDRYHICSGRWTSRVSNISASFVGDDTKKQMERIKHTLMLILEGTLKRSVHDIVFSTILLRSMDDFQAVNEIYGEMFSAKPNPPARVTVACGESMPGEVNVMVSVVVSQQPDRYRQCLHVQSTSYWAPANIGPYSQATSVPFEIGKAGALVYIAGQIPLVPASMEVVTRPSLDEIPQSESKIADFRLQTSAALQHLWRIGKAMNVGWWTGAIAFLVAGKDDIKHRASLSASAWRTIHAPKDHDESTDQVTPSDEAGFDVWNQQQTGNRNFEAETLENVLPDLAMVSVTNGNPQEKKAANTWTSPFFAVEIAQLPRGSEIEWQALGVSRAPVRVFEETSNRNLSITACSMASNETIQGFIGIKSFDTKRDIIAQIREALLAMEKGWGMTDIVGGHQAVYTSYGIDQSRLEAQMIPCKSVWDSSGVELAAAIVVHYEVGDVSHSQRTIDVSTLLV